MRSLFHKSEIEHTKGIQHLALIKLLMLIGFHNVAKAYLASLGRWDGVRGEKGSSAPASMDADPTRRGRDICRCGLAAMELVATVFIQAGGGLSCFI